MLDAHRVAGARIHRALAVTLTLSFVASLLLARTAVAQEHEHDDDHDHDHLHFSHPLVTESPSPDTKIRVDYTTVTWPGRTAMHRGVSVEAEYAFVPQFSLAITTPMVWRTFGNARASGVGETSIAAKFANFSLAARGVLLGAGFEVGLPTGSDANGIGSSHLVELEPFVDAAFKRDRNELVAFASLGATTRLQAGEQSERETTVNASALRHINSRVEALLELTSAKMVSGPDVDGWAMDIAPGIKAIPFHAREIMLGASVRVPVTTTREFDHQLLVSAMYHF